MPVTSELEVPLMEVLTSLQLIQSQLCHVQPEPKDYDD